MTEERLADLDELVLRCRSAQSRQYIAEAVACYRAGAYRSCIVATWIAVVYDILDKLRQLELSGDSNARTRLEAFETVRRAFDVARSLEFERSILSIAKDEFELLSPLEFLDLARLQEDRNRCAHPSMNSADETYQPTAELARYHLRNAVIHLLQRPPTQGKAALERLEREVDSPNFPLDANSAVTHFKSGPLAKPRDSLVRNFVTVLIKGLLFDPDYEVHSLRRSAALNAVRAMYPALADLVLMERLSKLVRSVSDDHLRQVVEFLARVGDSWQYVEDDVRIRVRRYLEELPDDGHAPSIAFALDVPELRELATQKVNAAKAKTLITLVALGPREEYVNRAVEAYIDSRSWDQANERGGGLIIPLAPFLKDQQIEMIKQAVIANKEIRYSFEVRSVLSALLNANKISQEAYDALVAHRYANDN